MEESMRVGNIVKWTEDNGQEYLGLITYIDGDAVAITWADGDENEYYIGRVKHKLEVLCE
jgi:hypothetical protein